MTGIITMSIACASIEEYLQHKINDLFIFNKLSIKLYKVPPRLNNSFAIYIFLDIDEQQYFEELL